jgi:hypothetical protein
MSLSNAQIQSKPILAFHNLYVIATSIVVGILLGWSLIVAYEAVEPCQASREWDVLRDVSIAQGIFDGRYPEDPVLSGEISWYNPLTGVILAFSSYVTGQPLMRLAVTLGPFINLLSPIAFYILVSTLLGRVAALSALCLMLFGKDGSLPFWTSSYCPWLLAPMYSMGLLFLCFHTYLKAFQYRKVSYFFLTGFLLGVTFMAHTAPAVIAGGTMLLFTFQEIICSWSNKDKRNESLKLFYLFLLLLFVAFFVSLPYSGPILWRYQFHVLNPWPSLYASQNVELHNLPLQIRQLFGIKNVLALLGVFSLLKLRHKNETRLLACWGAITFILIVQHYIWQALRLNDIVLTSIVPGHHAAIHLSCVRNVLFGAGVLFLGMQIGRLVEFFFLTKKPTYVNRLPIRSFSLTFTVLLICIMLYLFNPYSKRIDFKPPGEATYYDLYERHLPMYQWIRDNTLPEAVFLCPDESLGIQVVMPAGRKLVNPMLLYSNPYVDRGPLTLRQEAILKAIDKNDRDSLCREALPYPKLFLLLKEPVENMPNLTTEVYKDDGTSLYELHTCWKVSN